MRYFATQKVYLLLADSLFLHVNEFTDFLHN